MSVSFGCKCEERRKPVVEDRNWRVVLRRCNYSAFNGYHRTPSDYSTLICLSCRETGRTKAAYVSRVRDVSDLELGIHRSPDA